MKQITPDNIIILHPKITKNLFDLLGEIQINWKGMDWCSTGLSCEQGLIKIFPEKYNALAEPLRIRPDGVASINISFRNFPERFEHLLQIVRVNFPGISFQDIYIFNHPGYLDIYKYRYKPPTDWNFLKMRRDTKKSAFSSGFSFFLKFFTQIIFSINPISYLISR